MDEPMDGVEKGAVISVSIAGGIVIFVLCAVVYYIFHQLYCTQYYRGVDSSSKQGATNGVSNAHAKNGIVQVRPKTSRTPDGKTLPGGMCITLPDSHPM